MGVRGTPPPAPPAAISFHSRQRCQGELRRCTARGQPGVHLELEAGRGAKTGNARSGRSFLARAWVPTPSWNLHFLLRPPAGPGLRRRCSVMRTVAARGALGDSSPAEVAAPRAPRVPEPWMAGFRRLQKRRSQRRAGPTLQSSFPNSRAISL